MYFCHYLYDLNSDFEYDATGSEMWNICSKGKEAFRKLKPGVILIKSHLASVP